MSLEHSQAHAFDIAEHCCEAEWAGGPETDADPSLPSAGLFAESAPAAGGHLCGVEAHAVGRVTCCVCHQGPAHLAQAEFCRAYSTGEQIEAQFVSKVKLPVG